jgi:hypothetical protein
VAQDTTITSGITSSSTTVTVGATTGYPSSYPFVLALDYNTAAEELVTVTGVSGLTLTITRGYNGTTATAHNTGAVVRHVITAQDLTDAQTHYGTALSAGAHGVTGALATFLGSPTSTNFAAVLSDETGTGPAVFSNSPTLVTPVLGVATATSINGTTVPSSKTLVDTNSAQTLTNKSMDYNSNTFTNFPVNTGNTGPTGPQGATGATGTTGATGSSANLTLTLNAQTGTTYTLVSSDLYKLVTLSNASAITLTIPSAIFTTGQSINIQQLGAGQVTVVGDGTSTFTGTGTKLRTQYSAATIVCTGTNTFTLIGDIA